MRPICRLASECGGCTLQHQSQPANLAWKSSRVAQALAQAGYEDAPMSPPLQAGLLTRRRVDFGIVRAADGSVTLGLHRPNSRAVIDMTECQILDPRLFALLAPLRATLRSLRALGRTGSLLVNLLADGPDLLLRTDRTPDPSERTRLADFAAANGVCRIAWQSQRSGSRAAPEILAQLAPARLAFAGHAVDIPPGAFLQATRAAEAAITSAVIAGLPRPMKPKSRIIELYAGCGTITFALALHARIEAFEGDEASAHALTRAAGGTRVKVHRRDLARNPLDASEMRGSEAVVLDPPYAGAGRQIEQVARAAPGTVIIVSCNPAALRREATILKQAVYECRQVTVIDQFLFSPRIESVSVFAKASRSP